MRKTKLAFAVSVYDFLNVLLTVCPALLENSI
jgi:hypothetical protein